MAEAKFSGIGVVNMNGSVGNTCFARNSYGTYAKMRLGAPSGSAPLTAWNNVVAGVENIWINGLTDSQRQEWYKVYRLKSDSMADKNKITGWQLFASVNLNMDLIGQPFQLTPPSNDQPTQLTSCSIPLLTTSDFVVVSSGNAFQYCLVYASNQLPAGRMSNNQIFAFLNIMFSDGLGIHIWSAYTARYGSIISGKKIFVKFIPINGLTGVRGIALYASAIVP